MNKVTLYSLFIISTVIVLLEALTPLTVDNSIVYLGLLFIAVSTGILILTKHILSTKKNDVFYSSIIITALCCLLMYCLKWGGDWKTQTIMYQNSEHGNRTIEFQMRDIGALGYKKRIIDRIKIIPFINWIQETTIDNIDTLTWKKVDIDVNAFDLKGG